MAVSKKKTSKKKTAERKPTQSPAVRKKETPGQEGSSKRRISTSPPQGEVARLMKALEEARGQIRLLKEDRDRQVATAEATEMEHAIVLEQLEEAHQKIQTLERQRAGLEAPSRDVAAAEVDEEEEIDFQDDDQATSDDLDDVEAIYSRLDDPRVRRQELDRERLDRESEAGDEPYWMVCPKCGDALDEVDAGDVKLDRCETCSGIYLDHGEVEMLLLLTRRPDAPHRIRGVLQI